MIRFSIVFVINLLLLSFVDSYSLGGVSNNRPRHSNNDNKHASLQEEHVVVNTQTQQEQQKNDQQGCVINRRRAIFTGIVSTTATFIPFIINIPKSYAVVDENNVKTIPDTFDVDSYLRSGFVSNPMGVSGQAGKSRPETGVLLRDGSEVLRDSRTGNVLAEILVKPTTTTTTKVPVLASFVSPWPLATGSVFDVECRNPNTGDGTFLAVTDSTNGRSVFELPDSFFIESLISPTSRFAFYGTPTDIKIKKSFIDNKDYKIIDLKFSTLSQSTQTEIPRRARIVATIPDGTSQAVMLIGSSSASRWTKGSNEIIEQVIDSFRAIPAPTTSLRVRAKERRN